jgi:protein tyrosine/serine phosphatase
VDRHILLEGASNFRDLGGLVTDDGRTVRRGRLYRSDALFRLTTADVAILQELGIATIIDLRSDDELRRSGPGPMEATGVRHERVPIVDVPATEERTLGEMYIDMLDGLQDRFAHIVTILADTGRLPAIVHCWAGKDRTGIVTALILSALDVPATEIVADYALTEANMRRLIEIGNPEAQDIDLSTIPAHYLEAKPETMETFLAAVAGRWGSPVGYLEAIGIDAATLDRVRANLLEPVVS